MAVYEIGGERFEVPDNVQGAQLEQTLMQLSESLGAAPQTTPNKGGAELAQGGDMLGGIKQSIEQNQGMARQQEVAISPKMTEREKALSLVNPYQREILEDMSPAKAALIGMGAGFESVGRGVGLLPAQTEFDQKMQKQLEAVQPMAEVGKYAGQAAPFVPLGLGAAGIASTPLRVGATSATGALEGGVIAKGEGVDIGKQLLSAGIGGTVAGALELGLPVLGRMGSKLIRRVLGKTAKGAVVDSAGRPSAELVEALNKEGLSFEDLLDSAVKDIKGEVIDPSQAARKAFLESEGLTPTTAQITRDASDFQAQQEARKASTRVRAALEDQEAILSTRFDSAIAGTGGEAARPTNTAVDAIVSKATVLDDEISSLYKAARELAPSKKIVKPNRLGAKLKELAKSDRAAEGAISTTVGDLQARGIMGDNFNVIGRVNVETMEEVRQGINSLYDPSKPFRNIKLRQLKDALDDDVFKAAGGDTFKKARAAKKAFEDGLARAKVSKFDSRKANLVRDILENKVGPDTMTQDVIFSKKWRPSDIKELKDYLKADDIGSAAFNDLRADVLQAIKDKAFIGELDSNGFQSLSRNQLENTLNKIGKGKLNVLFTPKEVAFLDRMLKVSKLRAPVPGTFTGEGPSAQAINKLRAELRKGSIMANVVDSISFDKQGRAVLKAAPAKTKQPYKGSIARLPVTAGAVAAASNSQASGED